MLNNDTRAWRGMLLLLALSVTACATTSPPPAVQCPRLPNPPSVSTPLPQQSYSSSVQESLKRWREQLTRTPLTP